MLTNQTAKGEFNQIGSLVKLGYHSRSQDYGIGTWTGDIVHKRSRHIVSRSKFFFVFDNSADAFPSVVGRNYFTQAKIILITRIYAKI